MAACAALYSRTTELQVSSFCFVVNFYAEVASKTRRNGLVRNLPAQAGDAREKVWSLGWEDLLEKGMATHCSILAWRTPWTEEPGELQFLGSQRVGQDWATEHTGKARSFFHSSNDFEAILTVCDKTCKSTVFGCFKKSGKVKLSCIPKCNLTMHFQNMIVNENQLFSIRETS